MPFPWIFLRRKANDCGPTSTPATNTSGPSKTVIQAHGSEAVQEWLNGGSSDALVALIEEKERVAKQNRLSPRSKDNENASRHTEQSSDQASKCVLQARDLHAQPDIASRHVQLGPPPMSRQTPDARIDTSVGGQDIGQRSVARFKPLRGPPFRSTLTGDGSNCQAGARTRIANPIRKQEYGLGDPVTVPRENSGLCAGSPSAVQQAKKSETSRTQRTSPWKPRPRSSTAPLERVDAQCAEFDDDDDDPDDWLDEWFDDLTFHLEPTVRTARVARGRIVEVRRHVVIRHPQCAEFTGHSETDVDSTRSDSPTLAGTNACESSSSNTSSATEARNKNDKDDKDEDEPECSPVLNTQSRWSPDSSDEEDTEADEDCGVLVCITAATPPNSPPCHPAPEEILLTGGRPRQHGQHLEVPPEVYGHPRDGRSHGTKRTPWSDDFSSRTHEQGLGPEDMNNSVTASIMSEFEGPPDLTELDSEAPDEPVSPTLCSPDSPEALHHLAALKSFLSLPLSTPFEQLQETLARNASIVRCLAFKRVPCPSLPAEEGSPFPLELRAHDHAGRTEAVDALLSLAWQPSPLPGGLLRHVIEQVAEAVQARDLSEVDELRKLTEKQMRHFGFFLPAHEDRLLRMMRPEEVAGLRDKEILCRAGKAEDFVNLVEKGHVVRGESGPMGERGALVALMGIDVAELTSRKRRKQQGQGVKEALTPGPSPLRRITSALEAEF